MNKFIFLFVVFSNFSFSQSEFDVLRSNQDSLLTSTPSSSSTSNRPAREVIPSATSSSSTSAACTEDDQTSMPLRNLNALILEKNGALDVTHDPRSGSLKIKSPSMIGNCSSMIQWVLLKPKIDGERAYAVEARFKKDSSCVNGVCSYKVAMGLNGEHKSFEEMKFKPTQAGFLECLAKTGVLKDGKLNPAAIKKDMINETFTGVNDSGSLFFVSHGPNSVGAKPMYDDFKKIDGCDYYETAHPNVARLSTQEEADDLRIRTAAEELKKKAQKPDCGPETFSDLTNFIDQYEGYSSDLKAIRDELILKAAKKTAENLADSKKEVTEEDLKVLADFEKYIVNPKVEEVTNLYEQMMDSEGSEKVALQTRLKTSLAELAALGKKPYFTDQNVSRLIASGKFEEAQTVNGIRLTIQNFQSLGSKVNNVVITPAVAQSRVVKSKIAFAETIEDEREKFEYRTGQVSGKGTYYTKLATRMRESITIRTQNFSEEIQSEYARVQQPNGYCYRYFRNTQRCIQDSAERIQELQAELLHFNEVDTKRAADYDAKAKEYTALEEQGKRFIASNNGEGEPAEDTTIKKDEPEDTTSPKPRIPEVTRDNTVYNFQMPQQQQQQWQQQGQMTPQQMQYPMNPYANNNMFMQNQNPYMQQQQYNPWMGQQNYFGQMGMNQGMNMYGYQQQGTYNFQYAGTPGMQQPLQQGPFGYYQQPYAQQPYYNNQTVYQGPR